MKAIILKQQGGIGNFSLADIPIPDVQPGEVLVKTRAISINPADAIVRENKDVSYIFGGESPMILGWDISGDIVSVGQDVTRFKVGDPVFGVVRHPGHGKAYAEFVSAPANQLALKPLNITYEQAAATTLAALTALQPMRKVGIHKGSRILITAAGGGVGHFAIQLAKYFGAVVVALASGQKRDFVMGLGADEFIDYQTENFELMPEKADLVLDGVRTPGHVLRALNVLRKGGTLISLWSGITDEEEAQANSVGVHAFYNAVQSSGEDMEFIARLLEQGALIPHISKTFRFEEIPQAHLEIESGRTMGKLVVVL